MCVTKANDVKEIIIFIASGGLTLCVFYPISQYSVSFGAFVVWCLKIESIT